ncbi:TetR/AcrR family transcriptional regulator [uncultured Dietzia sp.]|uniref:TetR/AcrR family transcriptional regulator n=1 Tax=uncultured Dietzia sp. TaxID=395519 RepID=UPI0025E37D77|nr:TetR/AcrR family transcriptional regulator [uncultured Dietzia sp.]
MGRVTEARHNQPVPHRSPRTHGSTKEAILDSAELLFADEDVASVTMRAIAESAGVDPASVTYHFGGKTELVTAVIRRRYADLREHRMSGLAKLLAESTEVPTARQILDTIYRPWFELAESGDAGWRAYSKLISSTLASGRLDDLQDDEGHWDQALLSALRRAHPEADEKTVLQALMLTAGAAVTFVAPAMESSEGDGEKATDPDVDYRRFLHFVSSGFESMVSAPVG